MCGHGCEEETSRVQLLLAAVLEYAKEIQARQRLHREARTKSLKPLAEKQRIMRARYAPAPVTPRFKKYARRELTEEEGHALLLKYAPHWREHLRDVEVLRHIMYQVRTVGTRG